MCLVFTSVCSSASATEGGTADLTPEQSRRASGIFDSTMSPFCPGKTLASCPSGKATEWRADIRAWMAEGLSDDEILARLQAKVPGFQLESTPPTDWSWAGPIAVFALLTAAFVVGGRRAVRRRDQATVAASSATSEEDRTLLEHELQRHDA